MQGLNGWSKCCTCLMTSPNKILRHQISKSIIGDVKTNVNKWNNLNLTFDLASYDLGLYCNGDINRVPGRSIKSFIKVNNKNNILIVKSI